MLGAVLLLGSTGEPTAAHDPVTTRVTFTREIRAILQARCAGCHSPGGPAPMPLTSYDEVRPWARAIKNQVLTRRMPKWHAAHGYGAFANDPSLTPAEVAIVAAWVDGGQPRGAPPSSVVAAVRRSSSFSALPVPAAAVNASVRAASRWIGGWSFEPGDPLVTSATITSANGTPIGTWVAGDAPVQLPANTGIRVVSPIRIHIQRRTIADYEKPVAARRSVLRLLQLTTAPRRRVWTEQTACGEPRTGRVVNLLAVRPLLGGGASARVWLERPGAPRTIVGWFRDYETAYPRTYWLARPAELLPESRVQADVPCTLELTLALR